MWSAFVLVMNALLNKDTIARQNEQQLMQLRQDIEALMAQHAEETAHKRVEIERLVSANNRIALDFERIQRQKLDVDAELSRIYSSKSWRYTRPLRSILTFVRKIESGQDFLSRHHRLNGGGVRGWYLVTKKIFEKIRLRGIKGAFEVIEKSVHSQINIVGEKSFNAQKRKTVSLRAEDFSRSESISVIVCIHNALDDVKNCLDAVRRYSSGNYELILIDDGSAEETQNFVRAYAESNKVILERNEQATGYTFAANQGLRISRNQIKILLNSDTVVSPYWMEVIELAFRTSNDIGIVGPLSNTASWQSIPKIEDGGDWATNPLPKGWSAEQYALFLINQTRKPLFPDMPVLNGFCLAIHSKVIDEIGYFDEINFGAGYGEENDYCLRARQAGYRLILADNLYVFHAQSKSYSHERRKILGDKAGIRLAELHGQSIIDEAVNYCRNDKVLEGIRARAAEFERLKDCELHIRKRYEGKRVLFLLPVIHSGGGANIVIAEAVAMKAMGVLPTILNLTRCRPEFTEAYPELDISIIYIDEPEDLEGICSGYDAIVATANHTVSWLSPLVGREISFGYYIQDYEPLFFPSNSKGWLIAKESYHLVNNLKLFTKTHWNKKILLEKEGVSASVVGCSFDAQLYRPVHGVDQNENKIRIVAMVRPSSERRAPLETMKTLREAALKYGENIAIDIFGTNTADLMSLNCEIDFNFNLWGALTPEGVHELLCSSDIFVDFSEYQAMGLTAMEAMACGLAVIAPENGGAGEFITSGYNGLLIDTRSELARSEALSLLIGDSEIRKKLGNNAIIDMPKFSPYYSAANILNVLFENK